MSTSCHSPDRVEVVFDQPNLVSDSGLLLMATLAGRLGLPGLVGRWVHTGVPNAAVKVLTVVMGMIAGATNIDSLDRLRSGSTRKVLGFVPLAPSTIGTFLRSFTFGHVRQLDAVNSRLLANAWSAGAGPKPDEELVVDLDSTVTEVHGKHKHGASYGYTGVLGYHPLIATRAGTGEVLASRMRKGAAGTSRGVIRLVGELLATLRRAGVSGPVTVRADSGFWSWKLIDKLTNAGVGWSITVRLVTKVNNTIAAIPEEDWVTIDYTRQGHAQVAETIYTTGTGKQTRQVRLVVRRTRPPMAPKRRCGRPGDTTRSSATTPSPLSRPTGSTATTPWSSSPSANSKTTGSNTAPPATSQQTGPGSRARSSPTTSVAGPGSSPSTAPSAPHEPSAPGSSPSPGSSSTNQAPQPSGSPPTGHGHTNSTPPSTGSGHSPPPRRPDTQARAMAPHTPESQALTTSPAHHEPLILRAATPRPTGSPPPR